MPREYYSVSEAAKTLGISVDTLRRWDRQGRIKAERDRSNRRVVPASEIDRLRGEPGSAHLSARNRFNAIVTDVKVDGLMAQVEMVVSDPVRLVALVTRDAVEELALRPGHAGDRDRQVDLGDGPALSGAGCGNGLRFGREARFAGLGANPASAARRPVLPRDRPDVRLHRAADRGDLRRTCRPAGSPTSSRTRS